ncbi:MAG: hypothetical protein Q8N05_12450 [Bacteroidota bacterium]|nr:hypothetical protein [Bacteroidota bacterium]
MRKRKYTLLAGMILSLFNLYGQEFRPLAEGKVSYITSQNIYVKFEQAGTVQAGDTIYIRKDEKLIPLFVSESVSSTSCVGKPMGIFDLKIADVVLAKSRIPEKLIKEQAAVNAATVKVSNLQDTVLAANKAKIPEPEMKQKIRGRLALSSYSSFSNSSAFNQRMRYTFSLSADHISGSKFSADSYILLTHKLNHWAEVKDNVFNALKIYSLSVNYDLNKQTHFLIGRNINPRIASVGAIDGIQAETTVKNFSFGAVIGSNPDYTDYSFNPKLFEYGAYLSHEYKNDTGNLFSSFGFFQQTNRGMTDRRFAYFQHENSLIKNINLFASCELDLYALKNGLPSNSVSLTSLYLSLQYRMSRKLSLFASYDARKNVIYYETFKNYLDQMLEDATRQGYQFRINYRPANFMSSGITGGYRFRKNDLHPMLNLNGFLMFPQVPWINASVSLSTNWLQSSYVNGMIYGVRVDRDIVPSKLSSSISYRLVDNTYPNSNTSMLQHMAELELSWQINRKFSFSVNYDGTFDQTNKYNSIYINLIKRF